MNYFPQVHRLVELQESCGQTVMLSARIAKGVPVSLPSDCP